MLARGAGVHDKETSGIVLVQVTTVELIAKLPGRRDAYDAAGEMYWIGVTVLSHSTKTMVNIVARDNNAIVVDLVMTIVNGHTRQWGIQVSYTPQSPICYLFQH